MADTKTADCPDGHQWHDTTTGRVCAACLAEAPADPIRPDAPKPTNPFTRSQLLVIRACSALGLCGDYLPEAIKAEMVRQGMTEEGSEAAYADALHAGVLVEPEVDTATVLEFPCNG